MMFNNKKAEGVGTLIIFIALVLVAAVAAGVLIQTSSSLQSKSLEVGRQSQEKLTTDIDVVQIYAQNTADGSINGVTDNITMVVRLGSGSNAIKLSDLIVKLDANNVTQTLINGNATGQTMYSVNSVINGTGHQVGYLSDGDLAEFTFTVKSGINVRESQPFALRLIAKNGAVKPVDITAPAAMLDTITYLYP